MDNIHLHWREEEEEETERIIAKITHRASEICELVNSREKERSSIRAIRVGMLCFWRSCNDREMAFGLLVGVSICSSAVPPARGFQRLKGVCVHSLHTHNTLSTTRLAFTVRFWTTSA